MLLYVNTTGLQAAAMFHPMPTDIGIRYYCCYKCRNHISLHDDIISKTFQFDGYRGYLFSHVKNILSGPPKDQLLVSGVYSTSDTFCGECRELLGFRYEKAVDEGQMFKEGKFLISKFKIDMETMCLSSSSSAV